MDGLGEDLGPGSEGNIVLDLPLPPGTLATLWGDDERYISSYLQAFEGCYATGDSPPALRDRLAHPDDWDPAAALAEAQRVEVLAPHRARQRAVGVAQLVDQIATQRRFVLDTQHASAQAHGDTSRPAAWRLTGNSTLT